MPPRRCHCTPGLEPLPVRFLPSCWLLPLFCGLAALGPTASAQEAPAGYLLVSGWYKDRGVQREYTRAVGPVLKAQGLEAAVVAGASHEAQVIEGDWVPGQTLILLKFPSEKQAKRFWWSPEYQRVKALRAGASLLDVLQLDGVPGVRPRLDGRAAYLFFLADLHDRQRFAEQYASRAPDVVRAHGGEFLVRATPADTEMLEGAHLPGSLIVVEFPDAESLQRFWDSAEYQRLSEIRKSTGKWSVLRLLPRTVATAR